MKMVLRFVLAVFVWLVSFSVAIHARPFQTANSGDASSEVSNLPDETTRPNVSAEAEEREPFNRLSDQKNNKSMNQTNLQLKYQAAPPKSDPNNKGRPPPSSKAGASSGNKFFTVLQCVDTELKKPVAEYQGGGGGNNVDLHEDPPEVVVAFDKCIQKVYLTNPVAVQAANA